MRSAILKLGYRAGALLDALGLGRFALLRRLRRWVRRVLTRDRDLLVKLDGMPLYIRSDTETARQYLLSPFEPFTTILWKRAIRPGARVLDIGAQFGYFALLAAKQAGRAGTVYAFEPVPSNFRLLQRNVELNRCGNTTAVQKAVSDANTVVPMFVYQESDSHSMYRHPQASVREVVEVAGVALDDFLAGCGWDVIKMDIEGHEPAALRGMEETIGRSADLVLFAELAPAYLRRAGTEPRAYLAQLERLGFTVRLIDEGTKRLGPVTDDVLAAAERDPNWYANLYCTKGGGRAARAPSHHERAHRVEDPAERVEDESEDLERDDAQQGFRVARLAEDDRRVAFALGEREPALRDRAAHRGSVGQDEFHFPLRREPDSLPHGLR